MAEPALNEYGTQSTGAIEGTPSVEPGDPLAIRALNHIEKSRTTINKWRTQARECDRFAAGKHFSRADQEALEADQRPTAVFNAAQKWLRFISGLERQARLEVRFISRDPLNEQQMKAGELATKGYEWSLQQGDGESHRSRAFEDSLRRGIGFTDCVLDQSIDASGLVCIRRVDGHEMLWDSRSSESNFADARWMGRERQVSKEEALSRWGREHRGVILANVGQGSTSGRPQEATVISMAGTFKGSGESVPITDGSAEWPTIAPGNVRVIEYQWYDEVPGYYFYDPFERKDDWLSEKEFNEYRRRALKLTRKDLDFDRVLMREYQRVLIIGRTVVSGPNVLPGKRFTFNAITGQWDDEDRIWYGFFRLLMDPAKFLTKFANQMMEIVTRSAKGGAIVEEDAVVNTSEFERKWAQTGSISYVHAGRIESVKQKEQPNVPPAAIELANWCMRLHSEVTGVNPEATMGAGAGDVPLVTLKQRFAAMQTLLTQEFDSLRRYLANEARTVFDFLRFIADDRWIRVGGPFDAEAVQLVKAPFFLEYDVILDEGTRDPSIREQWWAFIEKLSPTLIRTNNFLPELLNLAPLPASYINLLKQSMQKQAEMQAQLAQEGLSPGGRGKPVGRAEVQARVQKLQADAAKAQAQAVALAEGVKNTRMRTILESIIKRQQLEQDDRANRMGTGVELLKGASGELSTLMTGASKEGQSALGAMTKLAALRAQGNGGSE